MALGTRQLREVILGAGKMPFHKSTHPGLFLPHSRRPSRLVLPVQRGGRDKAWLPELCIRNLPVRRGVAIEQLVSRTLWVQESARGRVGGSLIILDTLSVGGASGDLADVTVNIVS